MRRLLVACQRDRDLRAAGRAGRRRAPGESVEAQRGPGVPLPEGARGCRLQGVLERLARRLPRRSRRRTWGRSAREPPGPNRSGTVATPAPPGERDRPAASCIAAMRLEIP